MDDLSAPTSSTLWRHTVLRLTTVVQDSQVVTWDLEGEGGVRSPRDSDPLGHVGRVWGSRKPSVKVRKADSDLFGRGNL